MTYVRTTAKERKKIAREKIKYLYKLEHEVTQIGNKIKIKAKPYVKANSA